MRRVGVDGAGSASTTATVLVALTPVAIVELNGLTTRSW